MTVVANLSDSEKIIQLIGFYAGEKFFGADILTVQEILRDPVVEPVKDAPAFIEGSIDLRGQSIPLVDLRSRLDPGHTPDPGAPAWVLIIRLEENLVGYLVDSVTRIMKIAPEHILPAPELMLVGLRSQYILGVCKSELGLLIVTNLARMLEANEADALKKR